MAPRRLVDEQLPGRLAQAGSRDRVNAGEIVGNGAAASGEFPPGITQGHLVDLINVNSRGHNGSS